MSKKAPPLEVKQRGRPSLADKARGETRAQLLDAAADIFAKHGFEGASVSQIAGTVGITSGAVYRHFDGKADLLLNLIRHRGPYISLTDLLDSPNSIKPNDFAKLVSGYASPELQLIRRLAVEIHAAAFRDEQAAALLGEFVKAARDSIAAGIDGCKRRGEISKNLDSQMTADILFILIMGLANLDTIDPTLIGDRKMKQFLENSVITMLTRDYDE